MTRFAEWIDLASERLGGTAMAPNNEFFAPKENLLLAAGEATHARLRIYPDGGVSRLRLWGRPALATAGR